MKSLFKFSFPILEMVFLALPFDLPLWLPPLILAAVLFVPVFSKIYGFVVYFLWIYAATIELPSSDPFFLKSLFVAVFAIRVATTIYYVCLPTWEKYSETAIKGRKFIFGASLIISVSLILSLVIVYANVDLSSSLSKTFTIQTDYQSPTKKPSNTRHIPSSTPIPKATSSQIPTNAPTISPSPVPTFDYTLVAHKKSKVFHHPLCETVQYIPESSREYFSCSRSALIDQGYHPCSRCHGEEYTPSGYVQSASIRLPTAAPRKTATPRPAPTATPRRISTPRPKPTATPRKTATYIANTSTGKFHKPSCASVSQMKNSNKRTYTCTRDEMLYMGYEPCQRCHP